MVHRLNETIIKLQETSLKSGLWFGCRKIKQNVMLTRWGIFLEELLSRLSSLDVSNTSEVCHCQSHSIELSVVILLTAECSVTKWRQHFQRASRRPSTTRGRNFTPKSFSEGTKKWSVRSKSRPGSGFICSMLNLHSESCNVS